MQHGDRKCDHVNCENTIRFVGNVRGRKVHACWEHSDCIDFVITDEVTNPVRGAEFRTEDEDFLAAVIRVWRKPDSAAGASIGVQVSEAINRNAKKFDGGTADLYLTRYLGPCDPFRYFEVIYPRKNSESFPGQIAMLLEGYGLDVRVQCQYEATTRALELASMGQVH